MKVHALAGIAVAALISTPALAGHCPKDVQAIDAALQTAELSAEQKSKVTELRNEGDRLHKAGQHGQSLDALHEAMKILEIEH